MVTKELDVQNFEWGFDWDRRPYKIVNKYNPSEHYEGGDAYSIYADLKFWSNLSKDPLRNDVFIMRNGEQITYVDFLIDVKKLLQKDIAETKQLLSDLAKPDCSGYISGEYADQFDDGSYLRRPDGTEYKSLTSTTFYGRMEWLKDSVIPSYLKERKSTLDEVLGEIELIKGDEFVSPEEAVYMIMREDIRHLLYRWKTNVKMIGTYNTSEEVNGLIQKVANLLEGVTE